jgi:hypothetical protein
MIIPDCTRSDHGGVGDTRPTYDHSFAFGSGFAIHQSALVTPRG